jgi:GNAT superfamily N-acetyltransferase
VPDVTKVFVRPLVEGDIDDADRIFRLAFGTFLGTPDPEHFFGDADCVRSRWMAYPNGGLTAELDGHLIGSNLATNWGSIGFFGPLSVAPEYWDQGIAKSLLDGTMEIFASWGTNHAGLFTFAQSAKHVGLYQRFGFWPRFLTAVMARNVEPGTGREPANLISSVPEERLADVLGEVRDLTDAVYPGLDLTAEIESVRRQGLGDTLLLEDGAGLAAIAVCHIGRGTEAGGGNCYIKFGAVRPGPTAAADFGRLLDACHSLARNRDASILVAGANAARVRAWNALGDRGFRREFQGVSMHRPNDDGYSHNDAFIIDDWR